MTITAQAYADFLNGVYEVDGIAATLATYFGNFAGGAPVIDANGMQTQTTLSLPFANGAMNTKLFNLASTGFSLVLAGFANPGVAFDPYFQIDNSTFDSLTIGAATTHTDISFPSNTLTFVNGLDVQVAWSFDPVIGIMYASVNGSPVQSSPASGTFTDPTTPVSFYRSGVGAGVNVWIKYFAAYPLIDPALLPVLSVFGSLPPNNVSNAAFAGPYIKTLPATKLPGKPPLP